jgi:Ca2+-binding RTX toxin-like protein
MAQIIVSSDFTGGADGWTSTGSNLIFAHETQGGNPGGHILISDQGIGGGTAFFSAPAKFRGDKSAFIGGKLEFDIFSTEAPSSSDGREIRLIGDGLTIFRPLNADSGDEDQWNHESHLLDRVYWGVRPFGQADRNPTAAEFQRVLADLDQILILAEFLSDFGGAGQEETQLDNFTLTSSPVFTWQRLDSAQQIKGAFDTFAEAVADAAPGDTMVFVNPSETALDLGTVTVTVDNLTVQGGVLLDGTFRLGSGVEDFILKSASQTLAGHTNADVIGNRLPNLIVGSDGDNSINGGVGGGDLLQGKGGDDRYYVDSDGDRAQEDVGKGTDTVYTTTDFAVEILSEIEFLRAFRATQGLELTGNEFAQSIFGGTHNDTIEGGGGLDILRGLGGDDSYVVRNAGVRVVEAADQGDDSVRSTVDFVLGNNVENLELMGFAVKGIGNNFANVIDGNGENNILRGNDGNDVLTGKGGSDRMFGGADADIFVFGAPGSGVDSVMDWSFLDNDRFAVFGSDYGLAPGSFDPDRFDYKGHEAPTAPQGRFLWEDETGRLFWDADGNSATSDSLIAKITTTTTLSGTDFLVF